MEIKQSDIGFKEKAIELFNNFFNNELEIKNIQRLQLGFTNATYKIVDQNNNSYQVRIGLNSEIINRNNEYNILKCINNTNYLYFDVSNGNSIKKWIEGRVVDEKEVDLEFLLRLDKKINDYHLFKYNSEILVQDYFYYYPGLEKLKKEYLDFYKEIIDSYKNDKMILSHNDLNPTNIIITTNNEIEFIDFEWGRVNYDWFDMANFIREFDLEFSILEKFSELTNRDYKEFLKQIFACSCFAFEWTYSVKETPEIVDYRKKTLKKINTIYRLIKNN